MNYKTSEPCTACGLTSDSMVCYHHIKTRKAYPEYASEKRNMMPLCHTHHAMIHSIGITEMASRFTNVKKFLENNGFYFDTKWRVKWT